MVARLCGRAHGAAESSYAQSTMLQKRKRVHSSYTPILQGALHSDAELEVLYASNKHAFKCEQAFRHAVPQSSHMPCALWAVEARTTVP